MRALKKQISQLKFIPDVEQKFKNQFKRRKNVLDTGYPSNSPSHRKILNSCSNRKNKSVIKLIHATERVKYNEIKQKIAVDKLLDRVELDRNLIIKEKMKCIWGEQSAPKVDNDKNYYKDASPPKSNIVEMFEFGKNKSENSNSKDFEILAENQGKQMMPKKLIQLNKRLRMRKNKEQCTSY